MSKAQRPSHQEATDRGSPGAEQPEPIERLKQQLKIELDEHNARIDHLSKQRDNLQTDLDDLTTSMTEAKTVLTTYAGGLKDMEARLQSLEYFFEQKLKMVEAAIGHRKAPIDELISEFQDEVDRMSKRLEDLAERRDVAQAESTVATNAETTLQNEYDLLTQYQQTVTAKLTDGENLHSQIMHADTVNDMPSMYFLVLELKNVLRDTQIMSQHDLAQALRDKIIELEAAKELSRAKGAAYNALDVEYTAHAASLKAKVSSRREQLLAEIEKKEHVKPAPTPPTASAGASASGSPAPNTAPIQNT